MSEQYHDVGKDGGAKFALALLTPEEFFNFWPGIEKMLDNVPHTWRHWTKAHIIEMVNTGQFQVWCIGPPPYAVCVFFTQVSIHSAMKSFCVTWSAGHFDDDMIPLLEAAWENYAQLNGCSEVAIYGRPGWEPKLKRLGFTRASVWTRPVKPMRMQ